jgi:hypothetical protein
VSSKGLKEDNIIDKPKSLTLLNYHSLILVVSFNRGATCTSHEDVWFIISMQIYS